MRHDKGAFYLHANGEVIFKRFAEERDFTESDLVVSYWWAVPSRITAWTILVEALALGAKDPLALRVRLGCAEEDALNFAVMCGIVLTDKDGWAEAVIPADTPPVGRGVDRLSALVALAKGLDIKPSKHEEYVTFRERCLRY